MLNSRNNIYRTLWRWHFYAGLFCIPFIISLSVTGAIFLFKPQIQQWVERDLQNLAVAGERASPAQQINAAIAAVPGATFSSYRLPLNAKQAVAITLSHRGEKSLVYLNPYTLEVLKTLKFDNQFIRIIRSLHGELKLGNAGSILVELAGCWAIVLIVTGCYLWWPRSAKGLAGVLYPRIKQGKRKLLRDLHAVTGFWVAAFTLFLLISGLPWALVWGSAFKEIRSIGKETVVQDWSIGQGKQDLALAGEPLVLSSKLLEKAQQLNFAPPVELGPDRNKPQQWKLTSGHQNRPLREDAWFSSDAELIKRKTFSERSAVDKAIGIGVAAHEGHLFGWPNQLLGLFVCLMLVLISVSGMLLWYKRKPEQRLGAPAPLPSNQVGRTVFIVTLVAAIFLPLLLVSLVLIKVLESFLLSRIPATREWLGLSNPLA